MQLVQQQRIEVSLSPPAALPLVANVILSRAHRAVSFLPGQERLTCNAPGSTAGHVTIQVFGVPESFAAFLGRLPA